MILLSVHQGGGTSIPGAPPSFPERAAFVSAHTCPVLRSLTRAIQWLFGRYEGEDETQRLFFQLEWLIASGNIRPLAWAQMVAE